MNSQFTPKQRRALANATAERRQQLVREFRLQNSGRNILAYRGNPATRARARQNLPRLGLTNPVVFRPPTIQTRQNQNQSSQLGSQAGVHTSSGTSFFMTVTAEQDGTANYSTSIHPRHIAPLKPFTDMYQEWRYTDMAYRYVPTCATNHTGSVAWAIVANTARAHTGQESLLANPGSHLQSVVAQGPWIVVKPCPPGTWYQNIALPKRSEMAHGRDAVQAVRHPGWFSIALATTTKANVGYVEVRYTIHFRQQKV